MGAVKPGAFGVTGLSYPFVLSSQPDEKSLDFSSCMLRPGIKNAQELACGVCLLNVDSRSRAFNSETEDRREGQITGIPFLLEVGPP